MIEFKIRLDATVAAARFARSPVREPRARTPDVEIFRQNLSEKATW
jgi:hypothetical protein